MGSAIRKAMLRRVVCAAKLTVALSLAGCAQPQMAALDHDGAPTAVCGPACQEARLVLSASREELSAIRTNYILGGALAGALIGAAVSGDNVVVGAAIGAAVGAGAGAAFGYYVTQDLDALNADEIADFSQNIAEVSESELDPLFEASSAASQLVVEHRSGLILQSQRLQAAEISAARFGDLEGRRVALARQEYAIIEENIKYAK